MSTPTIIDASKPWAPASGPTPGGLPGLPPLPAIPTELPAHVLTATDPGAGADGVLYEVPRGTWAEVQNLDNAGPMYGWQIRMEGSEHWLDLDEGAVWPVPTGRIWLRREPTTLHVARAGGALRLIFWRHPAIAQIRTGVARRTRRWEIVYARHSSAVPGELVGWTSGTGILDVRRFHSVGIVAEITAFGGGTLNDNFPITSYDPEGVRGFPVINVRQDANWAAAGIVRCTCAPERASGNGLNSLWSYLPFAPGYLSLSYNKGGTATSVTGYVYVYGEEGP